MNKFGEQYNWLKRNIIKKLCIKDRKEILTQKSTSIPTKNSIKSTSSSKKTISTMSSLSLSRIGRPVGLTQVKNEIACKFAAFKKSQRNGKHMRKGQLEEIIAKIKKKITLMLKSYLLLSDGG